MPMSNNLVLSARSGAGLDRNMESLISDLRHQYAAAVASTAATNSTPLSQAMLFHAMSGHHQQVDSRSVVCGSASVAATTRAGAHYQANNRRNQCKSPASPSAAAAVVAAGRHLNAARATAKALLINQCTPLDLSVKTSRQETNTITSHHTTTTTTANKTASRIGSTNNNVSKCHKQKRQHLSLDLLKTIAQVIIQEKNSSYNQNCDQLLMNNAHFDQRHHHKQQHHHHHHHQQQQQMQHPQTYQTKLISSSASPSSVLADEEENDHHHHQRSPDRASSAPSVGVTEPAMSPCRRTDISGENSNSSGSISAASSRQVETDQVPGGDEIARRLAGSTDVISSSNGRRPRRQAGAKRQKATKSHLCNHCGRSFVRSDMLTRHSRLHSGLKPYQCGKCFQVFSRSDHLSTHERTHTGEKPYQCGICAYSACRRDMITRHMRTHLGQRVKRPGGQEDERRTTPSHQQTTLSTPISGNSASNSSESNQHNHNNEQSPADSYVPSNTTTLDAGDQHTKTRTGIRSFLYHENDNRT